MSAEFKWDKKKWDEFVKKIKQNLTGEKVNKVMQGVAFKGLKKAVAVMPKRTGATKRSWFVQEIPGGYQIVSASKVALFLEDGTKAHGPRTAKFLYIPLRPGAAVWRKGFVYGQDYVLAKRVKGIAGKKYLKPLSNDVLKIMISDFVNQLKKVA